MKDLMRVTIFVKCTKLHNNYHILNKVRMKMKSEENSIVFLYLLMHGFSFINMKIRSQRFLT